MSTHFQARKYLSCRHLDQYRHVPPHLRRIRETHAAAEAREELVQAAKRKVEAMWDHLWEKAK